MATPLVAGSKTSKLTILLNNIPLKAVTTPNLHRSMDPLILSHTETHHREATRVNPRTINRINTLNHQPNNIITILNLIPIHHPQGPLRVQAKPGIGV